VVEGQVCFVHCVKHLLQVTGLTGALLVLRRGDSGSGRLACPVELLLCCWQTEEADHQQCQQCLRHCLLLMEQCIFDA
jgi:hypothetical protein